MAQSYSVLTASKATKGSIKSWINYDLFDADEVLVEAEQWIYQQLRVEDMITVVTTDTMTVGTDTVLKPTRWRGPIRFTITGTAADKVELKTVNEVEANFTYDGAGARINEKPKMYYALSSSLQFEHPPDEAYPYRLVFYAALAPLTSQNETNILTDRYPTLLRAACMLGASEYQKDKDKMIPYWSAKAMDLVEKAHVEDDINRHFGIEADSRPE